MAAPRVFVSSAPADAPLCTALVADLRAAGADVWFDPTGTGDTEHELATRSHFLVVLSPAALTSPQVRSEVAGALGMLRSGALRTFVPVVRPGGDVPSGLADFPAVVLSQDNQVLGQTDRAAVFDAIGLRNAGPSALVPALRSASAHPVLGSAEPIVLPPQFTDLGFSGWHVLDIDIMLPPMRLVADGPFMMGSSADKAARDEQPVHQVTMHTYAIGTFPVTVAEYACFVGAGHALPPDVGRITWSGQFSRLDHPVVNVSWYDATAYAAWLSAHTGGSWRLPTEAEWERAARWDPATQRAHEYPWGDAFDFECCNTRESTIGATTPIHIYANGASPCGTREMVGNVREWTSTLYAPYPYVASDGREQPDSAGERVQRGGSWFSFASEVRAAAREWQTPDTLSPYLGFRLALDAPPNGSFEASR